MSAQPQTTKTARRTREKRPTIPAPNASQHMRFSRFRHKGTPTSRDIGQLLPADMIAKFGDIWELTGCNVAYWALRFILEEAEQGDMPREIVNYLEAGWLEQLDELVDRWEDERATKSLSQKEVSRD